MARHRLGMLSLAKHRGARRALVPLSVLLTGLLAIFNVFSVFTTTFFSLSGSSSAGFQLFVLTAVLSSLTLLVLLPKLRQRSPNAWAMTMFVSAVMGVNQWLHGSNVIIIINGLLVIAYLWWQRREFHGRGMMRPSNATARPKVRSIVQQHGRSAVSHLALLSNKSYWFSSGGSVVAYEVKARIALVFGDPIGSPEEAAVAIRGFRDFCHQQGWQPAFYQTEPAYMELYKAAGFEVGCIGYEGMTNVSTLKPSSTPFSAAETIEITQPPYTPALLNALREIDVEWSTLMDGDESYLSFSRFDEGTLGQTVLAITRDEQNDITTFVQLMLYDDGRKAAVDLLRRRHEIDGHTLDTLFDALCGWCQQQGVERLSWGLSLLSGGDEAAVGTHLNRFYEKQSLPRLPQKYDLVWEPRYVVFPGYASLPAVSLALTLASNRGSWRSYLGKRPLLLRQMVRLVSEQYKSQQTLVAVPLEMGVSEATSQSS